ncbi:MAG: AI-2E family transporter [Termitinemataceae bacterium]|nr:MAG: AI-2E family transporter [Termitinemataceae bacterium]
MAQGLNKETMEIKAIKIDSPSKFIQNSVFIVILIALFILVCKLFTPFFTVLLWSTILFVVLNPLHRKIVKKIPNDTFFGKARRTMAALFFAVGTALIILIPLCFVFSQFLKQILELIHSLRDTFLRGDNVMQKILLDISTFIMDLTDGQIYVSPDDIRRRLIEFLNGSLNSAVIFSKDVVVHLGSFLITMLFIVFCLFFFYLDAAFLSNFFVNLIPIRTDYTVTLVKKFKDITKNLFLGYIIVALFQAILSYFVFVIFHIKGALVFSCLVFICVFIPMLGGALVWLPLGVARIISGDLSGGIIFLLVSAVFISLLDNILRPFFLQNRIQLHPLIIFFAILGGLSAFGFNGLVLGPIIMILFLTVLDIFLTEHKIEHKKPKLSEVD